MMTPTLGIELSEVEFLLLRLRLNSQLAKELADANFQGSVEALTEAVKTNQIPYTAEETYDALGNPFTGFLDFKGLGLGCREGSVVVGLMVDIPITLEELGEVKKRLLPLLEEMGIKGEPMLYTL